MPSDEYQITAMVDFGTKVLGTQNATLNSLADFKKSLNKVMDMQGKVLVIINDPCHNPTGYSSRWSAHSKSSQSL